MYENRLASQGNSLVSNYLLMGLHEKGIDLYTLSVSQGNSLVSNYLLIGFLVQGIDVYSFLVSQGK